MLARNMLRSGRKQPQREHRVPGCGWRGRLHFRPAIFRTPPPLLSVALQYLLDLSAALHFLERLQYRFHRNLCGVPHHAAHRRLFELRGFLEWRLPRRLAVAPVQRQLMADRVAVAAGAQLFQHQILGARIVAAQSADVEQRLQAGITVAKDGTDTLGRQRLGNRREAFAGDQDVALHQQRDAPAIAGEVVAEPGGADVAADIDFASVHRLLDAPARVGVVERLAADLPGKGAGDVVDDAVDRLAPLQADQRHAPAFHHREAQWRRVGLHGRRWQGREQLQQEQRRCAEMRHERCQGR